MYFTYNCNVLYLQHTDSAICTVRKTLSQLYLTYSMLDACLAYHSAVVVLKQIQYCITGHFVLYSRYSLLKIYLQW